VSGGFCPHGVYVGGTLDREAYRRAYEAGQPWPGPRPQVCPACDGPTHDAEPQPEAVPDPRPLLLAAARAAVRRGWHSGVWTGAVESAWYRAEREQSGQ